MAHEIKVSRKKDYWMVSSGFKYTNLQKVGNSYPPSWCFSWYPLITGLESTNISSKKLLESLWHLVITGLQSLLIGVCTGAVIQRRDGPAAAAGTSEIDTRAGKGMLLVLGLFVFCFALINVLFCFIFFPRLFCQTFWQHPLSLKQRNHHFTSPETFTIRCHRPAWNSLPEVWIFHGTGFGEITYGWVFMANN